MNEVTAFATSDTYSLSFGSSYNPDYYFEIRFIKTCEYITIDYRKCYSGSVIYSRTIS